MRKWIVIGALLAAGIPAGAGMSDKYETLKDVPVAKPELGDVSVEERDRILQQWRDTAQDLYDNDLPADAIPYLQHVLDYLPDDTWTKALLEKAERSTASAGPTQEVVSAVETATPPEMLARELVVRPPSPQRPEEAKLIEANCDVLDGNYERAVPKFQWVIDHDPTLLGAWQGLGWTYWRLGREQDAIDLWKKLETLAPDSIVAHNLLAKAYIGQGRLDEAVPHLERSLKLDPTQYEIRYAYARVMLWQGRSDAAVPMLRALLKEKPGRDDVRLQLAHALDADRRYELSIDLWAKIREQDPNNPDYLLSEGIALLRVGDLEGARSRADTLIQMHQQEDGAMLILADAAEYGAQPAEAAVELEKIIGKTEDRTLKLQLLNRLLALRLSLHKEDPARYPLADVIRAADEGLKTDPRSVNFRLFKGEVLLMAGRPADAEPLFNEVLDNFNPQNRRAEYDQFQAYIAEKKLDKAAAALKQVETFDPKNPYLHYDRAMLAIAAGNFQEAYVHLDRLEREGARGAVLVLLYHSLSPSEYMQALPTRRFREQMSALKRAGFRFITPEEIPAYFASLPPPPKSRPRGLLRRIARSWHDAWSDEDTSDTFESDRTLDDYVPPKVVCVTFDDGLRSSFKWGTEVAHDMDLRFGMHIPVGNVEHHDPLVASWAEFRKYANEGCWSFGSHLVDASTLAPLDDSGYLGRPLPNRIWLAEKNRRETHLEYLLRIQREYGMSWQKIHDELDLPGSSPIFVAYPLGDIGQEDASDVENPITANLLEADLHYRLGFVQSQFGYAVNGDNSLLYQRHEGPRSETGQELLRNAYLQNPVYLARRLRAEVAAYEGRPHLAMSMVEALKRDGCPDEIIDDLNREIDDALGRKADVPTIEKEGSPWRIQFKAPYVGVGATFLKDNVETESWEVYGRAGINVTPQASIEGRFGQGHYEHVVETFRTEPTTTVVEQKSESTVTTITDGSSKTVEQFTTTRQEEPGFTSVVDRAKFSADVTSYGGLLTIRSSDGPVFGAQVLERMYTSDSESNRIDGKSTLAARLSYSGKPTLVTEGTVGLSYDVVPTARELVTYIGLDLAGSWDVRDRWQLSGQSAFESLSDSNTRLFLNLKSMWRISESQGIYAGLEGQFANSGEERVDYWTPHWLERIFGRVELRRHHRGTNFKLALRYGWGKEDAWPDEIDRYRDTKARAEALNFYPGQDPQRGWDPIVGVELTLDRDYLSGWEVVFRGSANELYNYSDHSVTGELLYHF